MNNSTKALLIALSLSGCSKQSPRQTSAPPAPPAVAPVAPSAPMAPTGRMVPVAPPPATATRPTIDPKSNTAAQELVHSFARLIDAGRFDDAYMLLGPNALPRADFDRQFAGLSHIRATPGTAGDQEGAAGSIYVSVPLTISGEQGGKHIERSAVAVLRRVNDVPGSTEAQRHWHIERIDWK